MRLPVLRVTLPLVAAAIASVPAQAQTFSNTTPIPIGGTVNALSDPYPSNVAVSGLSGVITDVNVTVIGWRHTFPDDVDLLLVGPGGQFTLLTSDAGGTNDLTGINVTFDDEAAAGLPDSAAITAGSFRPTNFEATADPFPAPAPAPGVTPPSLTVFDGTAPNGSWSLYLVDDAGADVGRLDGGFSIEITTDLSPATTFTASTPLRIHDPWVVGTPNPSTITVSGAPISLISVTVTLNDVSHLNPDDLDLVLVGPTGAHIVFFSDAGGTTDVVNATITLDDAAATILPDTTAITTGTFQPRNYGTDTPVVPPLPPYNNAATAGTATFTSTFATTDPNGVWSLYVTDDAPGAASTGTINGGWSITIVATPVELTNFQIE